MKKAYLLCRPAIPHVPWRELTLNNAATPKVRFILWLALHGKLATKDRLHKFGVEVDQICVFCQQSPENLEHLLFSCPVIGDGFKSYFIGLVGLEQRIIGVWKKICCVGKQVGSRMLNILVTEYVYAVWIERNVRIFQIQADLCNN